jgi:hypothetical protein
MKHDVEIRPHTYQILFPYAGVERETPTPLGILERAGFKHWIARTFRFS